MAYYSPKQKKINTDNFKASLDDAGHYSQKIIDKLEDLGILNETIVIFFSDHGTSLGEKFGEKMYGSFVYDYTIKTFFHFYTKELPNGLINNQIRAIDIMPTILDILKIPIDSQSLSIQGESLLDLISYNSKSPVSKFFSRPPKEKIAFVETGGLGGLWPSPDSPNVRCVRNSNYKLIHSLVPNKWEFYDLRTDPNELNNLILQKSKEIISLKKEMDKYI